MFNDNSANFLLHIKETHTYINVLAAPAVIYIWSVEVSALAPRLAIYQQRSKLSLRINKFNDKLPMGWETKGEETSFPLLLGAVGDRLAPLSGLAAC